MLLGCIAPAHAPNTGTQLADVVSLYVMCYAMLTASGLTKVCQLGIHRMLVSGCFSLSPVLIHLYWCMSTYSSCKG